MKCLIKRYVFIYFLNIGNVPDARMFTALSNVGEMTHVHKHNKRTKLPYLRTYSIKAPRCVINNRPLPVTRVFVNDIGGGTMASVVSHHGVS